MKTILTVEEVADICRVGKGKAYEIMRSVNTEMKEKGYLVTRGRVNSSYLLKRLGIEKEELRDASL